MLILLCVLGHLWGSPVDALLDMNGGKRFDLLLLADVLWLHSKVWELYAYSFY
jgi:hypothetical protein